MNFFIYYPTALCRVRITLKTSTNITQYLYSRGPVRQVFLQHASDKLDGSYQNIFCLSKQISFLLFSLTEILKCLSHIPRKKICKFLLLGHKNLVCWIINLLLYVLLCSIAENFYYGLVKIQHNL